MKKQKTILSVEGQYNMDPGMVYEVIKCIERTFADEQLPPNYNKFLVELAEKFRIDPGEVVSEGARLLNKCLEGLVFWSVKKWMPKADIKVRMTPSENVSHNEIVFFVKCVSLNPEEVYQAEREAFLHDPSAPQSVKDSLPATYKECVKSLSKCKCNHCVSLVRKNFDDFTRRSIDATVRYCFWVVIGELHDRVRLRSELVK
jgi:hypothetical protein